MRWSKTMMDMLPKTKRPPPRIIVRAKETPEAGRVVTWSFMMELSCTLTIIPNVMGYLPLNLGDAFAGWCGDNMFGMRTAPNGLQQRFSTNRHFGNCSTEGNGYKTAWRAGLYGINTDNYPVSWRRTDYLNYADYVEEHDDGIHVGIRRQHRNDYNEHDNFY